MRYTLTKVVDEHAFIAILQHAVGVREQKVFISRKVFEHDKHWKYFLIVENWTCLWILSLLFLFTK